jgi:flagellar hook-length control protein FliK
VIEKPPLLPLDKMASTEAGNQEPAASPAVAFETAQEEKKVAPESEKENAQDEELGASDAPASDPVQLHYGDQRGDLVREESPPYNPNVVTCQRRSMPASTRSKIGSWNTAVPGGIGFRVYPDHVIQTAKMPPAGSDAGRPGLGSLLSLPDHKTNHLPPTLSRASRPPIDR